MSADATARLSKNTKMAMVSQFLGFRLDAYDMALVLVMAPILVKVFASPKGSEAWQYITVVFTYSITMAARPVGSAIFGHYADKVGRRRLLILTIAGVGLMSGVAGFLPTYQQVGVWSYVLFCVIRFLMGCFFGGEYAVGHTFAIEYAPAPRRGAIGGFVQSGFPLGYVFASLVFAAIFAIVGKAAMSTYGWRIAFMTGLLPVLLALYIRRMLPESPEFEQAKKRGDVEKAPFFSLFKPPALWDFLQVFAFMTGLFLTDYSVYGFLPNLLTLGGRGFDPTTYSLIYGFALFMAFLGYNLYGWLSDITGRKPLTMWYCAFLVAFGIPVYYVLYHAAVARNLVLASRGDHDGGDAQACLGNGARLPLRAVSHEEACRRRRFRLLGGRPDRRGVQPLRLVGPQHPFYQIDRREGHVALPGGDTDDRLDHHLRQSHL